MRGDFELSGRLRPHFFSSSNIRIWAGQLGGRIKRLSDASGHEMPRAGTKSEFDFRSCLGSGFSLATIAVFLWGNPGYSQDSHSPVTLPGFIARLEIPVDGSGTANPLQYPVADVDLGPLPTGQIHDFEVSIFNATGSDIAFRKVVTGCACGQISFESDTFPAGRETKGRLRYMAPRSAVQSKVQLGIWFYNIEDRADSIPVASMRLRLSLADNLAIDASTTQLEVSGKGQNRFEFPVTVSAPILIENLVVEKSDLLRDVEAILESGDGGPRLVLQVEGESVGAEGVNGFVTLKDKSGDRIVRLNFWFARRPPVSLTPRHIRFRKSEEQPEKHQALVLVRVYPSPESGEIPKLTHLECHLDEIPLQATLGDLGSGVFSVNLHVPASEGPEGRAEKGKTTVQPGVLTWNFVLVNGAGKSDSISVTSSFEGMTR